MTGTLLSQPVVWGTSIIEVVAVVALLPTLAAILNHLVCHRHRCYRLGKYPHGHLRLCARHHPNVPDHGQIGQAQIDAVGR